MNMKLKSVMLGMTVASVAAMPLGSAIAKDYPPKTISMVAPSGAGGGWDLTIRTVAKTLKDTGIVEANMPITNRPGGGGAVNLAYMQTKKSSDKLISVYSPPILLTNLTGASKYSYKDTTPLARLITDYGAFVVSKDSEYKSINEVMQALKKDPKSVKIGGTSSAGSMDHIQFLLIAKAAGVPNLNKIDYISFQDGGAVAQVLGGHVDLISTGLGDITQLVKSGDLRALAQTANKRVGEGVVAAIPTVKEQGIDATFENWRGLFGPKDMPEYAVTYWNKALKDMVATTEWSEARKRNGWDDAYQTGEEFNKFLATTNTQYKEILAEIFAR